MVLPDSSSVIAFLHDLDRPDLLEQLCTEDRKLLICEAVAKELRGGKTGKHLHKCPSLEYPADSHGIDTEQLAARFPYLGPGEIGVLAWGLHHSGRASRYVLVLDDKRARTAASKLNLKLTGTIGIIRSMNDLGIVPHEEAADLEKTLRTSRFWYKDEF